MCITQRKKREFTAPVFFILGYFLSDFLKLSNHLLTQSPTKRAITAVIKVSMYFIMYVSPPFAEVSDKGYYNTLGIECQSEQAAHPSRTCGSPADCTPTAKAAPRKQKSPCKHKQARDIQRELGADPEGEQLRTPTTEI